MLTFYETQTKGLLQNPSAPTSLYLTADLDRWINIARGQIAGEARCIRYLATLNTSVGQRIYNFSALNTGVSSTTGIQAVIHIRQVMYTLAGGFRSIYPRAWEWFFQYHLNNPVPTNGPPQVWSQFGQGSAPGAASTQAGTASGGSFYLDPPPDLIYTLTCDSVCFPINLTDDTTVEALPYLWTDAVPYYAAYLALLSSQTSARQADANRMYAAYQEFMDRARTAANPDVVRGIYEQAPDPTQMNRLGVQPKGGQGA